MLNRFKLLTRAAEKTFRPTDFRYCGRTYSVIYIHAHIYIHIFESVLARRRIENNGNSRSVLMAGIKRNRGEKLAGISRTRGPVPSKSWEDLGIASRRVGISW